MTRQTCSLDCSITRRTSVQLMNVSYHSCGQLRMWLDHLSIEIEREGYFRYDGSSTQKDTDVEEREERINHLKRVIR